MYTILCPFIPSWWKQLLIYNFDGLWMLSSLSATSRIHLSDYRTAIGNYWSSCIVNSHAKKCLETLSLAAHSYYSPSYSPLRVCRKLSTNSSTKKRKKKAFSLGLEDDMINCSGNKGATFFPPLDAAYEFFCTYTHTYIFTFYCYCGDSL